MDFDASALMAPGPATLGTLRTVRIDMGRTGGPSVSVSVYRQSIDRHGFAVCINAAAGHWHKPAGPTFTRARGLTAKAAARIANLEAALLRSAYVAGVTDAHRDPRDPAWDDAAFELAAQIERQPGRGGRTRDAVAAAAAANALAEGEGE
jgi:hypothetical protein